MKLRPHHLLCTQGFEGKGYDPAFTENMTRLVRQLRADPDARIELVSGTDDLCEKCPNRLGEGVCASDAKVLRFDARITDAFGLQPGEYRYHDLVRRIDAAMTVERLRGICGDCTWFPVSRCREMICTKARE